MAMNKAELADHIEMDHERELAWPITDQELRHIHTEMHRSDHWNHTTHGANR